MFQNNRGDFFQKKRVKQKCQSVQKPVFFVHGRIAIWPSTIQTLIGGCADEVQTLTEVGIGNEIMVLKRKVA